MKHVFAILALFLAMTSLTAQEAPKYGDIPEGERITTRREYNEQRREAAQIIQQLERQEFDIILSELDRMVFQMQASDDSQVQETNSWGRQVLFPDAAYYGDLSDFYYPVRINIMDSGVDESHQGWAQDGVWLPEANYTGDPNIHWHGTHVGGIVWEMLREVSRQNGNIHLKDVQILNSSGAGSFAWAANAVATERAKDLESISRGEGVIYNGSFGCNCPEQAVFEAELQKSTAGGVVFVVANGNAGKATPSYPASSQHTISTAALDPSLMRASYSTIGEFTDIAMPGTNIPSYLPNNQQGTASGTSMASPFATATLALGMARYGEILHDQLYAGLYMGAIAKDIAPDGWDQMTGDGIVFVEAVRNTDPCDVPGIDCGGQDDPGDDPGEDPGDDPGDTPGDGSLFTTIVNQPYSMRWRHIGETAWRILTLHEAPVVMLSDQDADDAYLDLADWLPTYFRNRGIEVPAEMDVSNANFWTGQFLIYIAAQDGFELDLEYIICSDELTGGYFYADGFRAAPAATRSVQATDVRLIDIK